MPVERELYDVLGVSPAASSSEIKRAYRRQAAKWHPDKNDQQDRQQCEEEFKRITEAYEVLGNQQLRRTYDSLGKSAVFDSSTPSSPTAAGHSSPPQSSGFSSHDPFNLFRQMFGEHDPFDDGFFGDDDFSMFSEQPRRGAPNRRQRQQQQPQRMGDMGMGMGMGMPAMGGSMFQSMGGASSMMQQMMADMEQMHSMHTQQQEGLFGNFSSMDTNGRDAGTTTRRSVQSVVRNGKRYTQTKTEIQYPDGRREEYTDEHENDAPQHGGRPAFLQEQQQQRGTLPFEHW